MMMTASEANRIASEKAGARIQQEVNGVKDEIEMAVESGEFFVRCTGASREAFDILADELVDLGYIIEYVNSGITVEW